jgi:hypothetical protein
MTVLGDLVRRRPASVPAVEERWGSLQALAEFMAFNGNQYTLGAGTFRPSLREPVGQGFESYAGQAYGSNGIVFALVSRRMQVFSQARFKWQNLSDGRMFGTPALGLLERPWPGGTTAELLGRMEQDASLAGNFIGARVGNQIKRLRPDRVTIVLGSTSGDVALTDDELSELDTEVIGYLYSPPGKRADKQVLFPENVCHYSPIPDPSASYRGMSWLTSVLREVDADNEGTDLRLAFYRNGITPNTVVSFDPAVIKNADEAEKAADLMERAYGGAGNRFRTMYLRGAADVKVIGQNFRDLDQKALQGAGETRLAAAAGVPVVIAQFSEAMGGSSLNQGNFGAARRQFADVTMEHLWGAGVDSLAPLVTAPAGAALCIDKSGIPFCREDRKDEAEVNQTNASAIRTLIEAGYTPEAAVLAVTNNDMGRLSGKGSHTGYVSVQLQKLGANDGGTPA